MPLGNHFKAELVRGNIDFDADTFHMMLMASGFVFDIDAHHNLSDVQANELAAGNGYAAGGVALAGVAINEDDTNDRADVTWNNAVWTAAGGNIGPASGFIIYKNTGVGTTSTIIGHGAFGTDLTATDGNTFTVQNPLVRLS